MLFCAVSSAKPPETAPVPIRELDRATLLALQSSGAPSVSVAVVQNGRTVYAKAFGKANLQKDISASPETRYAIGSISKQFTAAALLLEEEKGRVSLRTKVAQYFPELTRANDVTIRELLSHTSGYEDYAPQDYLIPAWTKPTSASEILQQWARKPLNFNPGTQWQYSNTNFVLAAQIFEKASGEALVPFLRKAIFQPLGMTSAGNCTEPSSADAQAYTRYALGPPRPVAREAEGWYPGAAELCMTAPDLAKWNAAVLQKHILSGKSYREFTEDVKLADGKPTHYGLGVQVGEFHGTPQIMHSGEVSGFLAMNRVYPDKHIAVTVLSNEDGVNLIGLLSEQLALIMLQPGQSAQNEKVDAQIRSILNGLQEGKVNRELLSSNAASYFSATALSDYQHSLGPLGQLKFLILQSQQQRGGMTHLNYRAQYERKAVTLNIYRLPSGKFEQFMVEGQAE